MQWKSIVCIIIYLLHNVSISNDIGGLILIILNMFVLQ